MLEARIEELKKQLNSMVDKGLNSDRVYRLSVELDRLIVKYYAERRNKLK